MGISLNYVRGEVVIKAADFDAAFEAIKGSDSHWIRMRRDSSNSTDESLVEFLEGRMGWEIIFSSDGNLIGFADCGEKYSLSTEDVLTELASFIQNGGKVEVSVEDGGPENAWIWRFDNGTMTEYQLEYIEHDKMERMTQQLKAARDLIAQFRTLLKPIQQYGVKSVDLREGNSARDTLDVLIAQAEACLDTGTI